MGTIDFEESLMRLKISNDENILTRKIVRSMLFTDCIVYITAMAFP